MSEVKKVKPTSAKKDDGSENVSVPAVFDPRTNWFEERVLSILKLKNDKWKKLLATPECT